MCVGGWMVCSWVCIRSGAFLNCFPPSPNLELTKSATLAMQWGPAILFPSLALRFRACRTKPIFLWVHWRPCACSYTCMTRGSPTAPSSQPQGTLSKRPVSQFISTRYYRQDLAPLLLSLHPNLHPVAEHQRPSSSENNHPLWEHLFPSLSSNQENYSFW